MPTKTHASIELGQHGDKDLLAAARYSKANGGEGILPSIYHLLQDTDRWLFKPASEIKAVCDGEGVQFDGASMHCWFWVAGTAWSGSRTIRPFIPTHLHNETPDKIAQFAIDAIRRGLDLQAELGRKVIPMFWGTYYAWEVISGYPWGFWSGPGYDLIQEGDERFVNNTQVLRDHARGNGQSLNHEIHANTAARCSSDFFRLLKLTDNDPTVRVWGDPSHCAFGEGWAERFAQVGPYVDGTHIKDFAVRKGELLQIQPDWKLRAHKFCKLGIGGVDLHGYVELMWNIGAIQRFCERNGVSSCGLVAEAESDYMSVTDCGAHGIRYVKENLLFVPPAGSFQDTMAKKK
jgi:sugar phosphate isomerase/epimerase